MGFFTVSLQKSCIRRPTSFSLNSLPGSGCCVSLSACFLMVTRYLPLQDPRKYKGKGPWVREMSSQALLFLSGSECYHGEPLGGVFWSLTYWQVKLVTWTTGIFKLSCIERGWPVEQEERNSFCSTSYNICHLQWNKNRFIL